MIMLLIIHLSGTHSERDRALLLAADRRPIVSKTVFNTKSVARPDRSWKPVETYLARIFNSSSCRVGSVRRTFRNGWSVTDAAALRF